MRPLNRSKNPVSPDHVNYYNHGRRQQELENYKTQNDRLWEQLEESGAEVEKLQQEAEKASMLAQQLQQEVEQTSVLLRQKQKEKQGLLQRLKEAIASRDSMRGKLANMTAQRNRAWQEQKVATEKLVAAYHQLTTLQQEHDEDMTELAASYQEMTPEQRQALPLKLRSLLNQIEQDHKD